MFFSHVIRALFLCHYMEGHSLSTDTVLRIQNELLYEATKNLEVICDSRQPVLTIQVDNVMFGLPLRSYRACAIFGHKTLVQWVLLIFKRPVLTQEHFYKAPLGVLYLQFSLSFLLKDRLKLFALCGPFPVLAELIKSSTRTPPFCHHC